MAGGAERRLTPAVRQSVGMGRSPLKGTYYGDDVPGPPDLETTEGRQRMREIIGRFLATAEAGGASGPFVHRMRDDLASLAE